MFFFFRIRLKTVGHFDKLDVEKCFGTPFRYPSRHYVFFFLCVQLLYPCSLQAAAVDVIQKHSLAVDARISQENVCNEEYSSSISPSSPRAHSVKNERELNIDGTIDKIKEVYNEIVQRMNNIQSIVKDNQ